MRNGVPWEEAWDMSPKRRRAACIYFGLLDGREYDFSKMDWVKPK